MEITKKDDKAVIEVDRYELALIYLFIRKGWEITGSVKSRDLIIGNVVNEIDNFIRHYEEFYDRATIVFLSGDRDS